MSKVRGVAFGFAGLALLHILWLATKLGGERGVTAASDLIQVVPPLVGAIFCAMRARRAEAGNGRIGWSLLAASQAAWALGAGTWSFYEVVSRRDVPFPSIADVGFLAGVVLAVAGVLTFPSAPRRLYSKLRALLDGFLIAGSVLFVSWAAVLGPIFRAHDAGLLQHVLTIAYPAGDVVLVAAAMMVVARSARGSRGPITLVALGLLIYGVTDSTFIFLDLHGLYSTGSLIDVGWTIGPALIAMGAFMPPRRPAIEAPRHAERNPMLLLPYVPFAAALVTTSITLAHHGKLEGFLVWNGLGVILTLVLRQLMMLLDNVALSRGLETRVAERTAELSASEQRFRSLVQNSSDLIAIVTSDAVVSYISPSVEHVLGFASDAVLNQSVADFVHGDDRTALFASLAEALKHPGTQALVEIRLRKRDGAWARVEVVMTDLRSDQSVRGVVLNARDVTDRRRLEEQLSHQAFHDSLTGLANRAVFRDRVEHALRSSERFNEPLAVLFLDLDGFKAVNDSAGHAAGDELLIEFGNRLAAWARPGDTVARLGGDEFAILVERLSDAREAESIARRVVERSREPYQLAGRQVFVRVSVGIAVREEPGSTVEDMLRNADVAMYIAKARGKGRFEVFHPDMHRPILERLHTEAELRAGIEKGDLRVHYQPIVELASGRLAGLEALVRWNHPERGLVPPEEFIAVAEDSGLVHQLGMMVLDQACTDLMALRAKGATELRMSVNLSAAQFESPELPQIVASALSRSGLPHDLLTLEITESVVMSDTEATVQRFNALKRLGVGLAVDDFGTGYSSLNYLRRFPVDVLKIDRAFVRNIDASPEDAALAHAILKLAQTFKLEAVAEGIERREQLDELVSLGCRYGQGFYFAAPQSIDDLVPYLSLPLVAAV